MIIWDYVLTCSYDNMGLCAYMYLYNIILLLTYVSGIASCVYVLYIMNILISVTLVATASLIGYEFKTLKGYIIVNAMCKILSPILSCFGTHIYINTVNKYYCEF